MFTMKVLHGVIREPDTYKVLSVYSPDPEARSDSVEHARIISSVVSAIKS